MNRRSDPPGAYVANTGLWRPAVTCVSLKEPFAGLVVVGEIGVGVGAADGDRIGLGLADFVGVGLAAPFSPPQPMTRTTTANRAP
jgi:hypothetical protein